MPHEWEKGRYEVDASQADYSFPSWSPGQNTGRLVAIYWFGTIGTTPTLNGNGLTWTQIAALESSDYGAALFYASAGSPSAGVLTASFGTNPQRSCGVIIETPGTFTVIQSKTASTSGAGSLTVTLDSTPAAANWTFGVFNGKWPHTVGSGFTKLADVGAGTNWDQIRAMVEYKESGDQTIDSSFDYSAAVGVGAELQMTSGVGHTKGLDDTLVLGESRASDVSMPRIEAVVCSDVLARFVSRTVVDRFSPHDVSTFASLFARLLTETLAIVEARSVHGGKQLSDLLAAAHLFSQFSGKSLSENLQLTEGRIAGLQRSLGEVLSLIDAGAKLTAKDLLDALVSADSIAKATGKPVAEILMLHDARLASLQRSINEVLALADFKDAGFISALQLMETVALVDTLSRDKFKPLSEQLQLGDQHLTELRRMLIDQLAPTDSQFVFVARSLAEIATLRDQLAHTAGKNMNEPMAVSDNLSRHAFIIVGEIVSLSDAAMKSTSIDLPEFLSLSDLIEKLQETPGTVTLVESLLLLDSIRKDASVLKAEALSCIDALAKRGEIDIMDLVAVAEFLLKAPALQRLEELYTSDALKRAISLTRDERLQLNDTLSKYAAITLDDLLAALDAFSLSFVRLYGIIRLLSLAVRQSQISNLLVESAKLDLLRLGAATLTGIRLWPTAALVGTNLSISQLTAIRLES